MGDIFDTMVEFFQQDNWNFEQVADQPILKMGVSGKNGKWVAYAQSREEQDQFVFYSVCQMNTPEERRRPVAELLTRINYGLVDGNFELDFRDGEVRYKTSIDVENDRLSTALVRNLVVLNLQMMDRCLPSIMAVMFGGVAPEIAAQQVDTQGTPPS
jgi:hypothetical protein